MKPEKTQEKSVKDYTFIINQLAEKHRGFNLMTLNASLDYEKVFNKVIRHRT